MKSNKQVQQQIYASTLRSISSTTHQFDFLLNRTWLSEDTVSDAAVIKELLLELLSKIRKEYAENAHDISN